MMDINTLRLAIMKQVILILLLALTTIGCNKTNETPLLLPPAAEPAAKIHNVRGIEYFHKGMHMDALLAFTQASVADSTAGEIHFNLGLMQHLKGNQKEAKSLIKRAHYFADGNKKILQSKLLKKYLDP